MYVYGDEDENRDCDIVDGLRAVDWTIWKSETEGNGGRREGRQENRRPRTGICRN
ncbi:hypothetical protein PILCRDRAFT_816837 [Piloderma croceum F 1598]|uniref:Uncharacterized protein n=1 Tax=Piloderma croceum (strain F 1598) TaxID=765440 RepID=A0A0C3BH81_PILCF|nr:hypothetical protein PILCRDRAFT_816837 [Piloderma croceum F 1598]